MKHSFYMQQSNYFPCDVDSHLEQVTPTHHLYKSTTIFLVSSLQTARFKISLSLSRLFAIICCFYRDKVFLCWSVQCRVTFSWTAFTDDFCIKSHLFWCCAYNSNRCSPYSSMGFHVHCYLTRVSLCVFLTWTFLFYFLYIILSVLVCIFLLCKFHNI